MKKIILILASLVGSAVLSQAALTTDTTYDGVDFASSADIATSAGVHTPRTSASSGWQWGGFSAGSAAVHSTTTKLIFDAGANTPGSYAYTLFSATNSSINLSGIGATFKIQATAAASDQRLRWMVRDAGGNWFLSDEIWETLSTHSDARHMRAFPVARLEWTQITNGAQLDSMGATAAALSLGAGGAPVLSDVSGIGVVVSKSNGGSSLAINGLRVSEREALVYSHPGLASHWFEGFGGDLRIGMSDMSGACFNEAYWGGADNIVGAKNGRQCQYAFRSQYHSGKWNPTQAGFDEYYGTPIPIQTATSSVGTGVRYEYGPWPLSLWHGDGKMDVCENEELTLGMPYADRSGWKNYPFLDVDHYDDSQVTQADEATSDFMQGGFVEDVSSVTTQDVLALRLNLYQDFVRIGHNTLQFSTNAVQYDRDRTAGSEESIINGNLHNADISPLLPGPQSSSPVDMTTVPYRWAARLDVLKANFRYMWVPDPDTGAWTVHDLLPTTAKIPPAQGQSFTILANSADINAASSCKAVMVYYPEWSDVNRFSIQGILSDTGEAVYQEDRRTGVSHLIYQTTSGGWTSDSPPISLKFSKQELGINISGILSTNATPEGIHERFRQEFFWVFGTPEEARDAVADLDAYYLAQNNAAPVFSQQTLAVSIPFGASLNTNLSSLASDADGDALAFFKVTGPDWVSVSTNGLLSGTPGLGDFGKEQHVLVSVSDGEAVASMTVQVEGTTTYDGSGALNNADNWTNGLLPTDLAPGLVTTTDATSTLATWRGVAVRQTGGTLTAAVQHRLEAGNDLITESTQSILEVDDASNWNGTGYDYKNLDFAKLVMWDRSVADNKNTLSVLNGYADVGELVGTSTSKNTIHILHGKLDVGSITNANFTLNLLAGGTGQFKLAQADDNTSGTAGNDELRRAVLNFESGSQASFTIATLISTNGADARNYWADNFTVGDVQIDGVNVTDLSGFAITDFGLTGTTISLDFDPPTPNPATFSSAPSANGTAISMTATTGTDANTVWYYFAETSGNTGGTDSGWQTSPSYTDSGLDANTQYTYTVQMRDSAATPNVGDASSPASATTTAFAGDSFRPLPVSSSSSVHVNLDLLQWILPTGTGTITCDVVMGTAPVLDSNGFLNASDAGNTLIVDGQAVEEVDPATVTGGDPLELDTVYYWQVAVYDSAISTTVPSEVSPLYKFKTFDRYMEQLDRGLVAMNIGDGNVYLGWRMFKSDPSGPEFGFNVYRNGVKLTSAPITGSTNYLDADPNLTIENTYDIYPVYPVSDEMEGVASTFVLAADSDNVEIDPGSSAEDPAVYLAIPFSAAGGRSDTVDKMAVGDLDGDGKLDYVVKHPLGLYDPGVGTIGTQDNYKIAVYDSDGTFKWEVDLGPNITQGIWWSPMLVYDLDGDGKAEVITKTAPASAISRNGAGYLLTGDEYFTIYDGETGTVRAQEDWIARGAVSDWGDSYGNRVNRQMLGIAYLDGIHPSLLVMRGLYQKMVVEAWTLAQDNTLTKQWTWNRAGDEGGGFQQIRTGDVDGDGKEEIIHGSICIDDDGTTLWDTGEYHGDRLQLTDIDPDRPGLEIWSVQEDPSQYENPLNLRDASDGTLIYGVGDDSYADVGRGLVADIDPGYDGLECWSSTAAGDLHDATGTYVAGRPTNASSFVCDRAYWWGTDLLREISQGMRMFSWNYTTDSVTRIGTCDPIAVADVVGDWREEMLYYDATNHKIKIGTAITVTSKRFYTLMQDPIFRNDVSSSANGYQNSNYTTFYMGSDMAPPTPSTMTWSSSPAATGETSITMTATTATAYGFGGVEYYFDCETPGGHDSLWQTSPTYVDTLLSPGTQYTYKVKARGLSHLETAYSSPASATTDVYTAAEHFIAPTGSDASGDGSIANPYETITKAQSEASSGDTVYLRGGTYYLETSDVTYSFSAWDSVNHITKNGISYIAYQGEIPIFDFSAVQPVGRRVTAFLVEADNCVFEGFEVVGVQVTIAAGEANNTQSECFRIVGGNNNRFERLSMHDGMGIGWYLTSGGGNLVINCDAYNNKGLDGLSHGNIDGFGAHTNRTTDTGNTFIGCRAWFNSDDGFDLINNDAAVVISNCWAMYNGYDHESTSSKIGDSTGFKAGGYGVGGGFYPTPVPRNRVLYCLAVENSRGFYANHHTGGLDWIGNTAISNGTNYNMLNNLDATAGNDVPGFDHYMKNNLGYGGGPEVSDLGNSNDVTDNYWTLPVTVTADDFKSLSYAQLTQPRQADGSLPEVDYAHLVTGSDLIDAGTTTLVGVIPYYSGSAPDLGAFEYSAPLEFWNQWLNNYLVGMGSDINLQDDADGDRLVNLAEYAFGGDPSDSNDQGNTPIQSQVTDGGTNYIEYVYFERDDAATRGLNSMLTVTTDLMNTNWADGSDYEVGRGASEVPGYNAVTNRIPTDVEDRQFIRVEIELAP